MNNVALHIIHKFGMGGAETWLMEIFRELDKKNGSLKIEILITSGERSVFDEEAKKLGVELHYISFSRKNSLSFVRYFRKLLKEKQYCAIHDHQDFLAGWHFLFGLGRLPKIRICHVHNPSYQLLNNYGVNLKRRLNIRLGMWLVKHLATNILGTSNEVLCLSGYSRTTYSKQHPKALHCFFNVDKFKLNPLEASKRIKIEFGIPHDYKIVLFLGRLDSSLEVGHPRNHKNSAFALHVLSEIKDSTITVLFAGKNQGSNSEFLKKANELGVSKQIKLLGVRKDAPELIAASDLLFFPSRSEGLGMVAVEAQMSGTKVLASAAVPKECVVIPELVTFMDLEKSYSSWAKKIVELTKPYEKLIYQNDIRIDSSPFNIKVGLPQLEKLYKNVNT